MVRTQNRIGCRHGCETKSRHSIRFSLSWGSSTLLKWPTLIDRGALPPIIFLAMYRADSVAQSIGSLGYLVAIVSSLSFAMQPRARFMQSLIRHILFTCVAVPFTIFGLWCAREAKNNSQPAGSKALYNSSAAAVCAIFLFFNVFVVNAFRAVPLFHNQLILALS